MSMNKEKLLLMQEQVRIGGKGTARRKKKVIHKTTGTDEKKLQQSLKKLGVNSIPGIEEVNLIKDDGTVIHFNNPKVQASLPSNTFSINGHAETKRVQDLLPNILNQLGPDNLRRLVEQSGRKGFGDLGGVPTSVPEENEEDEVPDLVGEVDFEEASNEKTTE